MHRRISKLISSAQGTATGGCSGCTKGPVRRLVLPKEQPLEAAQATQKDQPADGFYPRSSHWRLLRLHRRISQLIAPAQGRIQNCSTGTTSPTNQPRKGLLHLYFVSPHLPQFQQSAEATPLCSLWLQLSDAGGGESRYFATYFSPLKG